MSDKDRPKADDGGGSGGGDEEGREGPAETEVSREGKCEGCGRKGKRLPFFRMRKSKKLLHQKRKQKGIYVNSRGWGRRANRGSGGGWCCLCVGQPKTLDSSGESPTSDPNSSEFTFDMLRALIEKNDFYSKECNPHLDDDDI
ncbi:ubiquitin carboxyl-terminal hydrolase-like protein [Perilla frutescens var. hirtella]|uniref:Ubiquitin carboxyl-terminal hydrolase-like protein n=1 Tax=Perilla frutescens var. hirtella TaxID=608512 RepID=A0AAD4JQF2_PERFH|nr:ubiquitin carboxyl-terminal hydrolase-like protein [Perilla frutescens var. frutescens]KAH6783204.1 ubiquitin carboxyl-terminal hydrolase-like protein [Perilla frutescens var. hirtella]KAH6837681.1 ubiquitin carboxyl-terminal hydrolase-like protein [Perilla frutescens var. hirtella]